MNPFLSGNWSEVQMIIEISGWKTVVYGDSKWAKAAQAWADIGWAKKSGPPVPAPPPTKSGCATLSAENPIRVTGHIPGILSQPENRAGNRLPRISK